MHLEGYLRFFSYVNKQKTDIWKRNFGRALTEQPLWEERRRQHFNPMITKLSVINRKMRIR